MSFTLEQIKAWAMMTTDLCVDCGDSVPQNKTQCECESVDLLLEGLEVV